MRSKWLGVRAWSTVWIVAQVLLRTPHASAQQSLFNVPSGDVTPSGNVFIQEQVSLEHDYGDSNLTLDVGMLDGALELGVDVFHVGLYRSGEMAQATPSVFGNVQLGLRISTWAELMVGTQQGVVHSARSPVSNRYGMQAYGVMRLGRASSAPTPTFIVGAYAGNRAYLGDGSRGGALLGYEIPLVGNRLMLMGDAIVGTNTTSVAVLGFQSMLDAHSHFQLAAGAQLPMPGTHNVYGCVLELTIRPMGDG